MTRHGKRQIAKILFLAGIVLWFVAFWQIKGHAESFETALAGEVMK